jgi:hypothetical protein
VSTSRHRNGGIEDHEGVATLVRSFPVRLVEVSRSGCRLECARPIESGTSGQLAVELGGVMRIDDIRVARCQQRMGAGSVYQLGAELLRTKRLGRRTVRMAVRKIIARETGGGSAGEGDRMPIPVQIRADEANGRSDGRAPPATVDRGS